MNTRVCASKTVPISYYSQQNSWKTPVQISPSLCACSSLVAVRMVNENETIGHIYISVAQSSKGACQALSMRRM